MARGTLILVVGPSGAGKDSLMAGAQAALDGDPRYVFARRVITRPEAARGEVHREATGDEFAGSAAAGGFMLSWRAHDAQYGISAALEDDLAAGWHVVANVSRGVIADAVRNFPPVRVIVVTAGFTERVDRLVGRDREDDRAIGARLARRPTPLPPDVVTTTVVNDGTLQAGIERFLAALGAVPKI
jgi:thymidine phosphorylase